MHDAGQSLLNQDTRISGIYSYELDGNFAA
jgi:hypothetical protein